MSKAKKKTQKSPETEARMRAQNFGLGSNIRELRTRRKLSLDDVSAGLDLSTSAVRNLEVSGAAPRLDTVALVLEAYGIDVYGIINEAVINAQ